MGPASVRWDTRAAAATFLHVLIVVATMDSVKRVYVDATLDIEGMIVQLGIYSMASYRRVRWYVTMVGRGTAVK